MAKECFYGQLQYAVTNVPATEILIPVGDWQGHVGPAAGVLSNVHGGPGVGTHNMDSERVLEFAITNGLCGGHSWFEKRDLYIMTYCSGVIQYS